MGMILSVVSSGTSSVEIRIVIVSVVAPSTTTSTAPAGLPEIRSQEGTLRDVYQTSLVT